MSNLAFIFPGQGSQFVGMGQDVYNTFESVRTRFQQANDILGYDLAELCFNGPEDQLNTTSFTQPAIFVNSFIMFELLAERNVKPSMVAGHSLGEFSALAAAGSLDFKSGLEIVQKRGTLMQDASNYQKGTMAAIIGMDTKQVESVCKHASDKGVVGVANYNSPGQVVISGTIEGVQAAIQLSQENGAKRAIELKVSGAFHSPLMEPALAEFNQKLDAVDLREPQIDLYSNVTAKKASDVTEIRKLLASQLSSPVLWTQTIQAMALNGAETFYEVGPGNVLTGLNRRIDRKLSTVTISSLEQIQAQEE